MPSDEDTRAADLAIADIRMIAAVIDPMFDRTLTEHVDSQTRYSENRLTEEDWKSPTFFIALCNSHDL